METIPVELRVMILNFLPTRDAIRVTLVSKRFHTLVYVHRLFTIDETRHMLVSHFERKAFVYLDGEFLRNPYLPLATNRCYLLRQVVVDGHANVVKYLLTRKEVDPATEGNWPVQIACKYGRLEVLRLLLKDPRVDPTARDGKALDSARSQFAGGSNPSGPVRYDFGGQSRLSCYVDIFIELILDKRIELPKGELEYYLCEACYAGRLDFVKMLIEREANPAGISNDPIHCACEGHTEIVRYLLGTGRIPLTRGFREGLTRARDRGDAEIVKLMEDYEKNKNNSNDSKGEASITLVG
jgi:ankyrin repeat protein